MKFSPAARNQTELQQKTQWEHHLLDAPTHDLPASYLQQHLATSNHENETFLIHNLILSQPLACIILVNVKETLLWHPEQANGEVFGDD